MMDDKDAYASNIVSIRTCARTRKGHDPGRHEDSGRGGTNQPLGRYPSPRTTPRKRARAL